MSFSSNMLCQRFLFPPLHRRFISAAGAAFFCIALLGPVPVIADAADEQSPAWHEDLAATARASMADIEDFADARWRDFAARMGFDEARFIATYRGYGNGESLWVRGRLLRNKPYGGPTEDDSWWDNLQATYERWESDEIPDAPVVLTYLDLRKEVLTDDEGYYAAEFPVDETYPRTNVVTAQHYLQDRVLYASHHVSLLDEDARYLLVSDVDDTVIHTGITNLLTSAKLTFLGNARTRQPLLGVGELYRSLAQGKHDEPVNPVVYVSNSGWNMYDLLRDFMDLNDLPKGPLLLRDLGIGSDTSDHKIETITRVVQRYDPLPVILIGDSGQHDAEIYAEVAARFPERTAAIYIRDVDPDEDSDYDERTDRIIGRFSAEDISFMRVADSNAIAVDLVEDGWLPSSAIDAVESAVRTDRGRETLSERVNVPGDDEQ